MRKEWFISATQYRRWKRANQRVATKLATFTNSRTGKRVSLHADGTFRTVR